jgi:hypothetical protein
MLRVSQAEAGHVDEILSRLTRRPMLTINPVVAEAARLTIRSKLRRVAELVTATVR